MSLSPKIAATVVRDWFEQLPPQDRGRSVILQLPGGRSAPAADTFVVPTSIEAVGPELVLVLDDWIELRLRGLERVDRVSTDRLDLGFAELGVSWRGPDPPRSRTYRQETASFVSLHRAARPAPAPPVDAVWENPL